MKLFIDTANIEEIKQANDLGVICGVTTNPSLIAKEGRDFKTVIKEITAIVDGPISAEVISPEADGMVQEAVELVKIHKNIVIKIPMTAEGLKATKILFSKGIKTEIISASIRGAMHVTNCAKAGADIATVPYKVIMQMIKHPLTDAGIEKSMKDWDSTFNK